MTRQAMKGILAEYKSKSRHRLTSCACSFQEVMQLRIFGIGLGTENKKLGSVFNFSLPSGITCPGQSEWCQSRCYASRYERRRPRCRTGYERNLAITKNEDRFAELMIGILPRILPCFRIHVAGDFHENSYVDSWITICKAFPQTKFWAYTRSWCVDTLK